MVSSAQQKRNEQHGNAIRLHPTPLEDFANTKQGCDSILVGHTVVLHQKSHTVIRSDRKENIQHLLPNWSPNVTKTSQSILID